MRNAFYFFTSADNRKKQLLLNDIGCSPFNLGFGYSLTSTGQGSASIHAIVQVSSEISVVQRIFDEFITGKSITQIFTKLNEDGIPTRQNRGWTYNSVSNILKNENYIGIFKFHKCEIITSQSTFKYIPRRFGEPHAEKIPNLAIIAEAKWNQVQKIRLSRIDRLQQQHRSTKSGNKRRRRRKLHGTRNPSPNRKHVKPRSIFATLLGSLIPFAFLELPAKALNIFRHNNQ